MFLFKVSHGLILNLEEIGQITEQDRNPHTGKTPIRFRFSRYDHWIETTDVSWAELEKAIDRLNEGENR